MILHVDGLHVSGGRSCSSPLEGLSLVETVGAVTSVPGEAEGWHLLELEEEMGQGQDPHFCACTT